jgi:alpha-galactosidase
VKLKKITKSGLNKMFKLEAEMLKLESESQKLNFGVEHLKKEEIDYFKISIEAEKEIEFPQVSISFFYPFVDIQSAWHPGAGRDKSLAADWEDGFVAKAASLAPVISFLSQNDQNRLSLAYSEAMETVNFKMGVNEESGQLNCRIILFTQPSKKRSSYQAVLRVDSRDIPYYQAIKEISTWYQSLEGYQPTQVPQTAKEPMYSSWYSFHQDLEAAEIEKEAKKAKKFGCEAVIVDDGWQTVDNNRGYAFCGDWEVAEARIPDMKKHVEKIHKLGLKYLLWYSVPFVGIHSKAWQRFKDKLLFYAESRGAGVLDPRYPEVREYLIETYKNAVRDWNLDGLKLDFIDQFAYEAESELKVEPEMDIESLDQAVDSLMFDLRKELQQLKPEIMIEFRQKYIGPYMRKYGNIFRVNDCPGDAVTNRVGTIDLRLLAGETAVHSDMLMWDPDDCAASAALQLLNVLFAVPQFSMKLSELSQEHLAVADFWLSFWKDHKEVLLEGELKASSPGHLYPLVSSENEEKKIIAVYDQMVIKPGKKLPPELIIVNATLNQELVLDLEEELKNKRLRIYNAVGKLTADKKISLQKGLHKIEVPPSSCIIIK